MATQLRFTREQVADDGVEASRWGVYDGAHRLGYVHRTHAGSWHNGAVRGGYCSRYEAAYSLSEMRRFAVEF